VRLPAVDPAHVNAARDLVLAAPEFNVAPDWRTRLLDWFIAALERSATWLPAGFRVYFIIMLLIGLVALVWWLLPTSGRAGGWDGNADAAATALPGPVDLDAVRAAARAAFNEGRLADCVRAVWAGALVLLDRAGISRASGARADWEHVEATRRSRADLVEPVSALVTVFQRSHFGAVPLARAEAEACLEMLTRLETALPRQAP
jgi:hypothetical protein